MTTTYLFKCAYTKSGSGFSPSPAAVCTVVDTSDTILANAQAVTVLANMPGVCLYSYTGADNLDLIGKFSTTDATVDQKDLFSHTPKQLVQIPINSLLANDSRLNNLDAPISGISFGEISGQVDLIDNLNPIAISSIQNGLATPANVWDRLLTNLSTSGSVGKKLADLLAVFNSTQRTLTSSGVITVLSPVLVGGDVEIVAGDDYMIEDGRQLTWHSAGWPDLTDSTVVMFIGQSVPINGNVNALTKTVTFELTKVQTAALSIKENNIDIVATLENEHETTLVNATMTVRRRRQKVS